MAQTSEKEKVPNNDPSWIGKKFGKFTITGFYFYEKGRCYQWNCICDCGRDTSGQPSAIRNGKSQQCIVCGTRESKKGSDLTIGERLGMLIVVSRHQDGEWICQCDCGEIVKREVNKITRAKIPGCNICAIDRNSLGRITHGDASSRLYNVWNAMHQRCINPKQISYKYYGAKGISVCAEWREFIPFKKWAVDRGYKLGLTIERRNPNGNYEPSNCEWITRSENIGRSNVTRWMAA